MKAKIAIYTILSALGIAGVLIYRYVTKGETVEFWEIVLTIPLLPLVGLAAWLRYGWMRPKIREVIEKAERDRSLP